MESIFRQARRGGRRIAGAAAYWSGLASFYELAARPRGAIVLMYHSVAADEVAPFIDPPNRISPRLFERQMAFLSRHRRVVPLSALVDEIASGRSSPAGTVAITFDDGYLDTLTVAAPILAHYRLPATLYLATGYIERAENQWADVVYCCFQQAARGRPGSIVWAGESLDLASAGGRLSARRVIHRRLLEARYEERTRLLHELSAQLAAEPPAAPKLSLDWNAARELQRRYPAVEFGGHTRDHVDLRTHRGAAELAEISGCAEDLHRELGVQPRHFSFPYGRWSPETRDMVAAAGWQSAVGDSDAVRADAESDRFLIPRIDAPGSMTELRFRTSGAYPGLVRA